MVRGVVLSERSAFTAAEIAAMRRLYIHSNRQAALPAPVVVTGRHRIRPAAASFVAAAALYNFLRLAVSLCAAFASALLDIRLAVLPLLLLAAVPFPQLLPAIAASSLALLRAGDLPAPLAHLFLSGAPPPFAEDLVLSLADLPLLQWFLLPLLLLALHLLLQAQREFLLWLGLELCRMFDGQTEI